MRIRNLVLAILFATGVVAAQDFIEKPYLQLGDAPALAKSETLALLWHVTADGAAWTAEVRNSASAPWRPATGVAAQVINAPGIESHRVFRATLTGLTPGEEFSYRVKKNGTVVFEASGRARKSATQPVRFALFGDIAQNTPGQRAVANQVFQAKPDFVFVAGDIVYTSGRISEYRDKYFPIYNADAASPETGAPLLRSVPFIAAPGNHDSALNNFPRFADSLAYFFYWEQPLNGPAATGAPGTSHILTGNDEARVPFLNAAGPRYPTMANFSFDYGNAHWTVLDSNPYMDWTNPALQDWIRKDLAASTATWKFVAFHHPGFNSSKTHFTDQWMRALAPVFEKAGVDVVFAGHVHNYQRSFPFTFVPKPRADGTMKGPKGEVDGDWKLDKQFGDGASSRPNGVIYIVSGGGGAGLYDTAQMKDPASWQPFTNKFISDENSFSLVNINGKTFELKQVTASGKTVDSFRIAK